MFSEKWRQSRCGFTLIELLTVIALVITIAALAVPNFTAMMKEQRMTSAVNAIQVAIMRARTYAVNGELDHSVEFCTLTDATGKTTTTLRIEAESAVLESIPNLEAHIKIANTVLAIPAPWYQCFLARRDAWGSDNKRFYTGIINCKHSSGQWGYFTTQIYKGAPYGVVDGDQDSAWTRLYYDDRGPYFPKGDGVWPGTWQEGSVSSDEATMNVQVVGQTSGYQDVNDGSVSFPWWMGAGIARVNVQDNLAVDSYIYLPYDINIDMTKSSLINYDEPIIPGTSINVCEHGWDATYDLRFGKTGYLIQSQDPIIVLKRGTDPNAQYVRLRMIRGTARLQKIQ